MTNLFNGQQMLEVGELDVGTLLEVEDLDPDEALRDGRDKVTVEANNAAEVQVDQEPKEVIVIMKMDAVTSVDLHLLTMDQMPTSVTSQHQERVRLPRLGQRLNR